ncbi:MAG: ABC transporter substrate-binding protein [Spirochaetes bacterium]|nr:MAG: ABC transporter substrate-binding protein [Spirochaetota bacterium]
MTHQFKSIKWFIVSITVVLFTVFSPSAFSQGEYEKSGFKTLNTQADLNKKGAIRVTDDLNNTVKISSKPQRIVSVTLMTDEILLSLVDKSRLIAVTTLSADPEISNVAAEVIDIPNKLTLNVETIISLNPDLVFLANWSDAGKVKQLKEAGLKVLQFKSHTNVSEIEAMILTIARAVGETKKGENIVDWMNGKLDVIEEKLSSEPQKEKLTVMDYGTWGSSFGKGSSWDEIIKLAGLKNAVADFKSDQWGNVPISKEKLVELNPDILILPGWVWGDPTGADKFYKNIVSDPALKNLKAVKNNRVFRIPEAHKSSTSQYIVYAVQDLAKLAYPDIFK